MEENKGLVINVGTSSVVLILLVLALSVFALLSIRASNSELQLAGKTGESVQEYYTADGEAEYVFGCVQQIVENSKINELEMNLKNIDVSKKKELENFQEVELHLRDDVVFTGKQKDMLGTIDYAIPIEEGKRLEVNMTLHGDRSLSVETWCMVKDEGDTVELGQDVELWDGSVTVK